MGTKLDFGKEQKRQIVAKKGFECPYDEIPKTGSYADQKRSLLSGKSLNPVQHKKNGVADLNKPQILFECPYCNSRVSLITTHVENKHPEKLAEFRKTRTKKAPDGTKGLRRPSKSGITTFTYARFKRKAKK